jgi:hypothetical protein
MNLKMESATLKIHDLAGAGGQTDAFCARDNQSMGRRSEAARVGGEALRRGWSAVNEGLFDVIVPQASSRHEAGSLAK